MGSPGGTVYSELACASLWGVSVRDGRFCLNGTNFFYLQQVSDIYMRTVAQSIYTTFSTGCKA